MDSFDQIHKVDEHNKKDAWPWVDTPIVVITLLLWILMLIFSFNKFLEVLAYHAVRNESQIDKNYRKYLHSRVQVYKSSRRRNAIGWGLVILCLCTLRKFKKYINYYLNYYYYIVTIVFNAIYRFSVAQQNERPVLNDWSLKRFKIGERNN